MPAPKGNTNAEQHGLYASQKAAAAGLRGRKWPKGCRYLEEESRNYGSALAAEVQAVHGSVSLHQLGVIDVACGHHAHSLFVLKILRTEFDSLTPDQKVKFSGEVALARQRRNGQVRLLELDRPFGANNPWDELIVDPLADPDPLADSEVDKEQADISTAHTSTANAQTCTPSVDGDAMQAAEAL